MTTTQGLHFLLVLTLLSSLGCSAVPRRDGNAGLTQKPKEHQTRTEVYADKSIEQLQRDLLSYAD